MPRRADFIRFGAFFLSGLPRYKISNLICCQVERALKKFT